MSQRSKRAMRTLGVLGAVVPGVRKRRRPLGVHMGSFKLIRCFVPVPNLLVRVYLTSTV